MKLQCGLRMSSMMRTLSPRRANPNIRWDGCYVDNFLYSGTSDYKHNSFQECVHNPNHSFIKANFSINNQNADNSFHSRKIFICPCLTTLWIPLLILKFSNHPLLVIKLSSFSVDLHGSLLTTLVYKAFAL